VGNDVTLCVLRGPQRQTLKMKIEAAPEGDETAQSLADTDFDMVVRDLTFADRTRRKLPESMRGVVVAKIESGGWASLGGLAGDDLVLSVAGKPTPTVAQWKSVLEEVRKEKTRRVVFFVRRGVQTRFCEVEPDWP
jgi:S1-C subfamily serine protease